MESIKPQIGKIGYNILPINDWDTHPYIITNLFGVPGIVGSAFSINAYTDELFSNENNFIEQAEKYMNLINKDETTMINDIPYKKNLLIPGFIIEYRNGDRRLILQDSDGKIFFSGTNLGEHFYDVISYYDDDLCHKGKSRDKNLDIVAVYKPKNYGSVKQLLESEYNLDCIWRRNRHITITLDEIAEKFGVNKRFITIVTE